MSLSYWESDAWFTDVDYCIAGSGITGLSCALELNRLEPKARILVLERGALPQGASTRNAGFACFGSLTEILDDLKTHSESEIQALVSDRFEGIRQLRRWLGDEAIQFRPLGGYEVFLREEGQRLAAAMEAMDRINRLLRPVFSRPAFELRRGEFGMAGILPTLICNPLEGQLHAGKMMEALIRKATQAGVTILGGVEVTDFEDQKDRVRLRTPHFEFDTRRLLLATNGFAAKQTGLEVLPARGQVLVTEPVAGLELRGSFHLQEGYYYFRNVGDRVLVGGGRHLDKAGETTTDPGQTDLIQDALEDLLRRVIVPGRDVRVARRWSGIMGVGPKKKPIIRKLSANVSCGVRLGGMGVAIGSQVGAELAALAMTD